MCVCFVVVDEWGGWGRGRGVGVGGILCWGWGMNVRKKTARFMK